MLTHACFTTGLLRPLGASRRDLEGNLDPALCASGVCLDAGERGMCSEPCESNACPTGCACKTFGGGDPTPHSLATYESLDCDADPGLKCQQPGAGFSVDETPNAAGYCAPL